MLEKVLSVLVLTVALSSPAISQTSSSNNQQNQEGNDEKIGVLTEEQIGAFAPKVRAELFTARSFKFQTRKNDGMTVYVLTVSALMPNGCNVLRLIEADNEATKDWYEVLAQKLNTRRRGEDCLEAEYDDVETMEFYGTPGDEVKGVRVLGSNKNVLVYMN